MKDELSRPDIKEAIAGMERDTVKPDRHTETATRYSKSLKDQWVKVRLSSPYQGPET